MLWLNEIFLIYHNDRWNENYNNKTPSIMYVLGLYIVMKILKKKKNYYLLYRDKILNSKNVSILTKSRQIIVAVVHLFIFVFLYDSIHIENEDINVLSTKIVILT